MSGTSATTFDPDSPMSRAMVWTVIARLAGENISGENWAEDARAWAMAAGVSDGTNADGTISREEIVTMLYRYAGSPAVSVSELGLLDRYPDSSGVSTAPTKLIRAWRSTACHRRPVFSATPAKTRPMAQA